MAETEVPPEYGLEQFAADLSSSLEKLRGSSKKGEEEDGEEDKPFEGKNLREAEREAYIRVRAHNRRLRRADEKSESNS